MPDYLTPGVYIEEVELGPPPITGVSTSIAGFVGVTQMGPTTGQPTLVTSYADFERVFGGFLPESADTTDTSTFLAYAVQGFFANGGEILYVSRVVGTGATPSALTLQDSITDGGSTYFLTRPARQMPPAKQSVELVSARFVSNGTQITLIEGGTRETATVDTVDGDTVTFTAATTNRFTTSAVVEIPAPGGFTRDDALTLTASSEGTWGGNLRATVTPSSRTSARVLDVPVGAQLRLAGAANLARGDVVEFTTSAGARTYGSVTGVSGDVVTFAADVPLLAADDTVRTADFDVLVELTRVNATTGAIEVVQSERYTFLTLGDGTPNDAVARINEASTLVGAARPATTNAAPEGYPTTIHVDTFASSTAFIPGAPGDPVSPDDLIGDPGAAPGDRKGLQALQDLDEISIIAAPGFSKPDVHAALIEQCERLKYRFAVLEAPRGTTIPNVEAYRNQFDTRYAAIYYPWLTITDPLTGRPRTAPPSGHVVGVYARVDNTRGVHKAPANETISGITGLEYTLTAGEQGVLNEPRNINVVRDFRQSQRGIRIWGARCVTSDTDWKYVNVRRLFIYLEHSLDKGTQWVVFEPNSEPLWARARQSVSNFLTGVWRDGALQGTKAEQAFFVTCDRTTMTQDDIDNGRLIMVIGVAPVYPAEFVIIRIGQQVGGAAVSES
jgi:phage tail sheath protein FI